MSRAHPQAAGAQGRGMVPACAPGYVPEVLEALPRHLVSATGIVFDPQGRVLAISRADDGSWVPPGGMVELAEAPADAVVREVAEETGVQVAAVALTGVYKHMGMASFALAFRCRVLDAAGQAQATVEARQVAWLTLDQATARMAPALAARVLDACQRPDAGPSVRLHDGTHLLDPSPLAGPTARAGTSPALVGRGG
jgi:8-oxo-dGTP diphosphatase